MSAERTRFRCAPLSVLRHGRHYLLRQVGPRSRCAQSGLLRCSPLHLLPLRAPPECQIPASGRARALLIHPATLLHIVLTQPLMICVSNEEMRYSTWPLEKQVREGHPGLQWIMHLIMILLYLHYRDLLDRNIKFNFLALHSAYGM